MLAGDERSDGTPLVSDLSIVQQHKIDKPEQLSVKPTVQTQSRSSSPMQASLSEVCLPQPTTHHSYTVIIRLTDCHEQIAVSVYLPVFYTREKKCAHFMLL